MTTYTKTRTNVYSLNYHMVWVTKYRKEIFNTEMKQNALKQIILSEASNHEINIQELEIMPDHVHLLFSIPPKLSISNVARILKGRSAYLYFQQFPEMKLSLWGGHLWSGSYFVSSTGSVTLDIIKEYIQNQ